MASRRARCNGCGRHLLIPRQVAAVQCSACQAVTRFQSFEPRVDNEPRQFNSINRVSSKINPVAVAGLLGYNNGYNYYADLPPQPQPPPWPAFLPPPAHGRKKALLCGISYRGTTYKLSGCVNDVKRIWFLLVDTLGFPRDSILTLTEEEMDPIRIPTKQNMRSAMRWLVQDLRSGDSLFFFYSGHGSRQKDYNGDEIDGFDETICPLDYETEGPIIDDEINATIVRPLPRGVKLHAVIDTCYSGTVLDLPFMCRINRDGNHLWEDQRSRTDVYKGTSGGIAFSFSACADHQTSASTVFTGRKVTGVLTSSFIKAVQNEAGLTYGGLLDAIRFIIPSLITVTDAEENKLQEPQLCSSQKFDIYSTQFTV